MPNYDYKCQSCDHVFEVFQSMNDAKLEDCPEDGCDGKVKRLLGTGAGLIFKGGGFYETDYRSQSYKDGAKKESEARAYASSLETLNKALSTAKASARKMTFERPLITTPVAQTLDTYNPEPRCGTGHVTAVEITNIEVSATRSQSAC